MKELNLGLSCSKFLFFAGLSLNLDMYVRYLHLYVCMCTCTRVHTPSSVHNSVFTICRYIYACVHICILCRIFTFYVCKSINIFFGGVLSRMVFSTPRLYYKSICGFFLTFYHFIFHV